MVMNKEGLNPSSPFEQKRKNMADDLCFITKDGLIIKAPKKSPLVLRMFVLFFAMVCGVYICSVCMRQVRSRSNGRVLSVKVVERPCEAPIIQPSEKSYVHFPKPNTFARAECECNPVRYFAILSTQRSGSGWFETMLNSHINISSNGEIFSNKVRRSNASTIVATLDKIYNLDWLTSASKNECTAAVGLKWMLNQGLMQHHVEVVEYFKSKGVSAIFLFRRNLLRRMISILANSYDQNAKPLNGTHKSHVHSPQEAEILARYKPAINTTLLIPNLRQVEEMVTKSLEYFKSTRHIILYYEDIIKNRTSKPTCTQLYIVKQNDSALHKLIDRFKFLHKTGSTFTTAYEMDPPWMDEGYIQSCFAQTGEVVSVKVIRNRQTGQSERYGFVEFSSHAAAEKVLQSYNGAKVVVDSNSGRSKGYGFVRFSDENEKTQAMTEMNGVYCSSRPMRIGVATPKKQSPQQQYSSQAVILAGGYASNGALPQGSQSENDSSNTTIFVGGLDSDVTDVELRHSFTPFGEVISVKIPSGKGCGFVQFANRSNAEDAMQRLNGAVVGKQTVRLSWGRNLGNKQSRMDANNQWGGSYYGRQGYNGNGYNEGAVYVPSNGHGNHQQPVS
ncbi:Uncharacterized protein Adt_46762 [Abeliophyllum distichum]|uniref:RRM domain-containing protein n=1 Tax=Abeliophyllum distichum TaxID=126358 RepID=A0ABD1NYL8_9LAMI